MILAQPTLPLTILRLHGEEREMGRQHGDFQRQLGGHLPVLSYYASMPVCLLKGSQPAGPLRVVPDWAAPAVDALMRRLHRDRPGLLRRRSEAYMRALGLPPAQARHMMTMDVFQNLVGLAGRARVVPAARGWASGAIAACSSVAVWGAAVEGAALLHARNFDFPGIGLWDAAPTVVLCSPDKGLRYGYASSRGVDAPVVSLWNEAGLCVTTHTHLHREVRFGGAAVMDLCHEIIRRARTLDEAAAIARERPVASTWGLLVSAVNEASAVLIETTARRMAVTRPEPGDPYLACTNHYLSHELQDGELAPNSGYAADSHGRLERMVRAVRESLPRGGLSALNLQALLGDHEDCEVEGLERGAGGVLAQPMGVHSIVMDPGGQRCFVSTDLAPTGRGAYAEVPWNWSDKPGFELVAADRSQQPPRQPSRFDTPQGTAGYAHFLRAVQLENLGAEPAATAVHIARAAAADPDEATWQLLHAGFAMRSGDLDEAAAALHHGLSLPQAEFYTGRMHLWASRVASVQGDQVNAIRHREALLALDHPLCQPLQDEARVEAKQGVAPAKLRHVTLQCFMGAVG
jgi:hypothetical protein